MKKISYIILALIIIAGGYYFYDQRNKQAQAPVQAPMGLSGNESAPVLTPTPSGAEKTPSPTTTPTPDSSASAEGTFSSGDEEGAGSDIQVVEVVYDGVSFSPASLDVKVNDYVFFKNNSDQNFWPASAPHPSHTDYPEFDAKAAIAPGKSFKFQFTKAGNWKYHNHLNPSAFGVVNVK